MFGTGLKMENLNMNKMGYISKKQIKNLIMGLTALKYLRSGEIVLSANRSCGFET